MNYLNNPINDIYCHLSPQIERRPTCFLSIQIFSVTPFAVLNVRSAHI